MPLTLTNESGLVPRSIIPHRMAQLNTTAIKLRMLPFVLGARSSDFNHSSTVNGAPDRGINPLSLVRVKGISRRQAEPRILAANEIQALIAALSRERTALWR